MGMEEKRYKVYIVIFVITTVIASCVAVYFGIASFKGNEENTLLQEKVNELNTDNETLKNEESKTKTKTEIVEKEVVKEATIPKYDPSRIKNKKENVEYDGSISLLYGNWNGGQFNCSIDTEGSVEIKRYNKDDSRKY